MNCRYNQNGPESRSDSDKSSIRNQDDIQILRVVYLIVKVYFLIAKPVLLLLLNWAIRKNSFK